MKLTIENKIVIGNGKCPQAIHTNDNVLRIFYLTENKILNGMEAVPILGLYENLIFKEKGRSSPDSNISNISMKRVAHYGAYGFMSAEGDHKFITYMMPSNISNVLVDGSTTYSASSEVSSLSCSLLNVNGEVLNENRALVTPGTKLEIYYSMGDSEEIVLGNFYIDRASISYPDEKISVSARNAIGKLLKEQTFNEDTAYENNLLIENLQEILKVAEVDKYFVGDAGKNWNLNFVEDLVILDGIKQVISLLPNWKIDETQDGVIGIAAKDDPRFDQPSLYIFERDKTCFSYNIEFDDSEAASKVCIRCNNPEIKIYKDVLQSRWWAQPTHRTLFVDLPEGVSEEEANNIADELSQSLAISGKLESFVSIFTPYLTIGDEVKVINEFGDETIIGIITDVSHNFGRGGFYTSFTVDSGGRKSKPSLSSLIGQATNTVNTSGVIIS